MNDGAPTGRRCLPECTPPHRTVLTGEVRQHAQSLEITKTGGYVPPELEQDE
ncbi:MAG: hypothetical protein P8Y36_06860 [Alphaproteobacteria bacterium]